MVIEEKLARARTEYQEKLHGRLQELAGLLRKARDDAAEHGPLHAAQRLAHRICGTAGTFGFSGVSDALARVDMLLLELLAGRAEPVPAFWTQVEQSLRQAINDC
jgi:chemotaxis protein histidine kinase CheA